MAKKKQTETISYPVVNLSGKEVKTVDLDASVWAVEAYPKVVCQVVRWHRASWRSGTHATLNRAKMDRGSKKPWRQKGTGRARAGSSRSPLWPGGAVAHGPQPRDYSFRLNKKERKIALRSVISDRVANKKLILVDDLKVKEGKTKEFVSILENLKLQNGKVLLVVSHSTGSAGISEEEKLLVRSAANVSGVEIVSDIGLNIYGLLNREYVLTTESVARNIESRLKAGSSTEENIKQAA